MVQLSFLPPSRASFRSLAGLNSFHPCVSPGFDLEPADRIGAADPGGGSCTPSV